MKSGSRSGVGDLRVQGALDNLKRADPAAYQTFIKESNTGLELSDSMRNAGTVFGAAKAYLGVLDGIRKKLGRDQTIGNALILPIRRTGGCDVAGDKFQGCK